MGKTLRGIFRGLSNRSIVITPKAKNTFIFFLAIKENDGVDITATS